MLAWGLPGYAEPEAASVYGRDSLRELGDKIVEDPALIQLLFAMPPDAMEQVEAPTRPPHVPEGWLGITHQEGPPLFMKGAKDFSPTIQVLEVYPHSSAQRAGLRPGDIILATDGKKLSIGVENSLMMNFSRRIRETETGKEIQLTIKRDDREMVLPVKIFPKPTTPVFIKPPRLESSALPDSLLLKVLRRHNRLEDYAAIVDEIRVRTTQAVTTAIKGKTYNPFRLQTVNTALNQPLDLPLVSNELVSSFRKNFVKARLNAGGALREAVTLLDFKVEPPPSAISKSAGLEALLDRILQAASRASRMREEALKHLSLEDREVLRRGMRHLMVDSLKPMDLLDEEAWKNQPSMIQFFQTALKADMKLLLNASLEITRAIDLRALMEEKNQLDQFSVFHQGWIVEEGEDVVYVHTPHGLMIIGGEGDNDYSQDALLIVDLGGNDRYRSGAGSSRPAHPFSVVIDFSGDDVYISDEDFAQGAGFLGGGFLIDLEGDDRYIAQNFGQGAGVMGVGLLIDATGNDEYRCHSFCQGAGFMGVGLIAEPQGNDQYSAAVYSQGFGFTRGIGVILEGGGDDRYFAGGVYPDRREPGKAYLSMSQGFGLGLRPWGTLAGASGGIGIIDDQMGNDNYISDYFAQGSAYWYGLGILNDSEGHDLYSAGRYAPGAGIHLAAGILNDNGGDDHYLARFGVSQGCGHDLAVGFLIDNGGTDRYIGGTLSQGAGNGNGFGVLNDNGGDDEYFLHDQGQGHGNAEPLRDLDSFGILFDTGGGEDHYSLGGANNQVDLKHRWGLHVDIP